MKQISIVNYQDPLDDRGGGYAPPARPRPAGSPPPRRNPQAVRRPQGGGRQNPPMRPHPQAPQGRPPQRPPRYAGAPVHGPGPAPGPASGHPRRPQGQVPPRRRTPPAPPSYRQPHYEEQNIYEDDFYEDEEFLKKNKRNKMIIIALDVMIVVFILAAAWFFIYPKLVNKKQMDIRDDILKSLKQNVGKSKSLTVEVPKDKFVVPGERLEEGFGSADGDIFQNTPDSSGAEEGNVNIQIIGRIVIAKIACDCPIAADAAPWSLRFATGKWPPSAPFSENGTTMIFGHRFLDKGRDFNRLDEVKKNDGFFIDSLPDNKRYHYKVYEVKIIPQGDLNALIQNKLKEKEDNEVMLITCHPLNYGSSKERLLVFAKLSKTEEIPESKD